MDENQNIYQKLQHARVMLQEQAVTKSGKNNFTKFNYLELTDFLPQANGIFDKLGLVGIFDMTEDKATLTVVNTQNKDEQIVFGTPIPREFLPQGQNAPQARGSLHTYFRRYLYINALEIAVKDTIDDKPQEEGAAPQQQQQRAPMDFETAKRKLEEFLKNPVTEESKKKAFGWAKHIIASSEINDQLKSKLLLSIDVKYGTNYQNQLVRQMVGGEE